MDITVHPSSCFVLPTRSHYLIANANFAYTSSWPVTTIQQWLQKTLRWQWRSNRGVQRSSKRLSDMSMHMYTLVYIHICKLVVLRPIYMGVFMATAELTALNKKPPTDHPEWCDQQIEVKRLNYDDVTLRQVGAYTTLSL